MHTGKNLLGMLLVMMVSALITFSCKTVSSNPSAHSGENTNAIKISAGDNGYRSEHVEQGVYLTGTYSYGSGFSLTFSGNNYTLSMFNLTYAGTYSMSGNTFTLAGHGSSADWVSGPWTIVDENTVRDSDGDLWRKQGQTVITSLSGTYNLEELEGLIFINFSGNNFSLNILGYEAFYGRYSVSGSTFTLTGHGSTDPYMTGRWTIVDLFTLKDPDGYLWEK